MNPVLQSVRACHEYLQRGHSRMVSAQGERRSANRHRWPSITSRPGEERTAWVENSESVNQVLAVADALYQQFMDMDMKAAENLLRVQSAMRKHKVGPHCFSGSTGYGHGDIGRATFDSVFAEVLATESCMARASMAGADHALSCALFACLRPQDHVMFLTGTPDASTSRIIKGCAGSLDEWGISSSHVDLMPDGTLDIGAFAKALDIRKPKAVVLQRSPSIVPSVKGPQRQFLSLEHLRLCMSVVQQSFCADERPAVIVDNRHAEFVEPHEPGVLGVDLMTGTFLGCIGGSVVPSGGYVAGTHQLVEKACSQFCAPGMSLDAGAVPGDTLRLLFQGLFLAPGIVSEAQKGSLLLQNLLPQHGAEVLRNGVDQIHSPFLAANMESEALLEAVLYAVNESSCFPADMKRPDPRKRVVQRAGGGFVQGCMAELGASGVMREPFPCVLYGGTHWSQWVNVLSRLSHAEASQVQ